MRPLATPAVFTDTALRLLHNCPAMQSGQQQSTRGFTQGRSCICRREAYGVLVCARAIACCCRCLLAALHLDGARPACGTAIGAIGPTLQ